MSAAEVGTVGGGGPIFEARQTRAIERTWLTFPAEVTGSSGSGKVRRALSAVLTRSLRGLDAPAAFALLVTGLQALIYRYLDQDVLTVLVPADDRGEVDGLVPCVCQIRPSATFADLHESVVAALAEAKSARAAERADAHGDSCSSSNIACYLRSVHGRAPAANARAILRFQFDVDEGNPRLEIEFDPLQYSAASLTVLAGHFSRLLEDALSHRESALDDLALLLPEEIEWQIRDLGARPMSLGPDATIHALFEAQVRRTPERIAAVCDTETLTYEELNARANRIARTLLTEGVQAGDVVGLLLERSCALLAAVLGVLKAGAAFLMLDPYDPRGRIEQLLGDGERWTLLGRTRFLRAVDFPGRCIDIEQVSRDLPKENLELAVVPGALAYLIFTSGSTGEPKGVLVRHAGFVNRMRWLIAAYSLSAEDVSLQKTPLSFDPSICEMLRLLPVGGRVAFLTHGEEKNPAQVLDAIERHRVTVIDLVPSPLTALLEYADAYGAAERLATLRWVLAGAETLPPTLAALFLRLLHRPFGTQLINTWGATETTVDVTLFNCSTESYGTTIPVGKPIANVELCILSRAGRPMPLGMVGELHVGGSCLAAGYLNDPALTARRFVPIAALGGHRYYKSGDAARFLPDGNIEFVRRIDDQLKIRGVRIDPHELELALLAHPQVARVLVRGFFPEGADAQLLVYVARRASAPAPTPLALLQWLRARLPAMLIPDHIFVLDRFQTNANEKVDVRALPLPGYEPRRSDSAASYNAVEWALAQIWVELLASRLPALEDSFFALGGHSLAAARLVARVFRRLGARLSVKSVFAHPTLRELAAHVASLEAESPAPFLAPSTASVHLASHAQMRIWLLSQFEEASSAYSIPLTLSIASALSSELLQQSLDVTVGRHEILRTTFLLSGGELVQTVHPPGALPVRIESLDLCEAPNARQEANQQIREWHRRSFDLRQGPLMRILVIQIGPAQSLLALTIHHIIADAWSLGLLARELFVGYAALLRSQSSIDSAPPSLQYKDYSAWEHARLGGPLGQTLKDFWRKQLSGELVPLALQTDFPRPSRKTYHGRSHEFFIAAPLLLQLNEIARAEKASLFMVLLAAYAALLHRYTGQADLIIGTPVAGRDHPDLEALLGCFVNSLPLRLRVNGSDSFTALLSETRERCLLAFENQSYPFDRIVSDLGLPRMANRSPLFDVMMVLQNAPDVCFESLIGGTEVLDVELDLAYGKLDLILTFEAVPDGRLSGTIQYNTDLFLPETIAGLAHRLVALLSAAVLHPDGAISQYALHLPAQAPLPAGGLACPRRPLPLLHQFFESQTERTPDSIAISYRGCDLTYRSLNESANRLAHYLRREHSISPDCLVAILLNRSERIVITELAVLKAGGAFLPIDSSYPDQRIGLLLADSKPALVLVENRGMVERLGSRIEPVLCWDELDLAAMPTDDPLPINSLHDLAYVIYTSGSTGQPKGTLIEHGNIASLLGTDDWLFDFRAEDSWSWFHSVSFDFSVWEVWVPLSRGARVVLVPAEVVQDPKALAQLVVAERVSVLCQVPSAFNALAEYLISTSAAADSALRWVIFGGEPVNLKSVDKLRACYPDVRFVNGYGITETTIFSSFHELIGGDAQEGQNIGRPISNQYIRLLHDDLTPVPDSFTGEICIGGASVGRGYLNRPELTAARYVSDPAHSGERLYRSGDLARRLPSGELAFIGRKDNQIKLRGFRIEPDEIRRVILEAQPVSDCAILEHRDRSGDTVLIAYLESPGPVDLDALRSRLAGILPHYMVPSRFGLLREFPRGPNGKLDRSALSTCQAVEPQARAAARQLPISRTEQRLLSLWQELLEGSELSVTDDFFLVGGHSLKAVQMVARIQAVFDVTIDIADVFIQPTIAGLARCIDAASRSKAPFVIAPAQVQKDYALSPLQLQFFLLEQFCVPGQVNNVPEVEEIRRALDLATAAAAVDELFARFEILRTTFALCGTEPRQRINGRLRPGEAFRVTDVTSASEPTRALQEIYDAECLLPFELSRGPLLRLHLVQLAPERFIALWSLHHIISDGATRVLLSRMWHEIHDALLAGDPPPRPAMAMQYKDFSVSHEKYLASPQGQAALAAWVSQLEGCPPLRLPGDTGSSRSFYARTKELRLDEQTTSSLKNLCSKNAATLFIGLQALIKILLHLTTGATDVTIGSPATIRIWPELEEQPGPHLNVIALRDTILGHHTLRMLLGSLKETLLWAYKQPLIPIEHIVARLAAFEKLPASRQPPPLFEVGFTLQSRLGAADSIGEIRTAERFFGLAAALWFDAVEWRNEVLIRVAYDENRFTPDSIDRLCGMLSRIAKVAVEFPDLGLQRILESAEGPPEKSMSIDLDL